MWKFLIILVIAYLVGVYFPAPGKSLGGLVGM